MTDKKQTLRVVVKLMSLVMVGFLVYVFLIGLVGESEPMETLMIDVREIAPGEVKVFNAGKRKLLVLHRSPEQLASMKNTYLSDDNIYRSVQPGYFVAWAYDPFLGCAIEYQLNAFKAICANNFYDLAGRSSAEDVTTTDLQIPEYQFVDNYHIEVNIDD